MAEINTSEGGNKKHKGGARSKKMSTKVDLTPMVDLAFLLITFFMLTTTLNKPNAMEMNMPKKTDAPPKVNEELILNLILDKDNVVWYYEGTVAGGFEKTQFSNVDGVRDVIYKKQEKLLKTYGSKDTMICLIKSTNDALFKNLVNALDEMDITKVKKYATQEILPLELEAIKNGGNANTVKN